MLDKEGREIPSNIPVAAPVGFRRPLPLSEQVKRMIRFELSEQAAAQGEETFEEADDFDIGDDYDPKSPYEQDFDHDRNIADLKAAVEAGKKARAELVKMNAAGVVKKKPVAKKPAVETSEGEMDEQDAQ